MVFITKEFRFEAAHRLPCHEGACWNLHGHSYKVVVTLGGNTQTEGPATGMVMDFKDLSSIMKDILEVGKFKGQPVVPWDHALILWCDDPLVQWLKQLTVDNSDREFRIFRTLEQPTAEYMADLLASMIQEELYYRGFDKIVHRVEVWETAKAFAAWQRGY